jgi:polyisoprenoid-binding protein YceI
MIHVIPTKSKRHPLVAAALVLLAALLLSGGQSLAEKEEAAEPLSPGSITFVGRNMIGKAKGTFHEWRLTRANIDRENPAVGEVEIEIDIASIDTGIGRRDNHLRSDDFFDIEKFPKATVRVHDAVRKGKSERGLPLYGAQFTVRIRDVEKTLEGEFELTSEDPPTVEGGLELNRMDFGVGSKHSGWNPMSVKENIPVRFFATLSVEE